MAVKAAVGLKRTRLRPVGPIVMSLHASERLSPHRQAGGYSCVPAGPTLTRGMEPGATASGEPV